MYFKLQLNSNYLCFFHFTLRFIGDKYVVTFNKQGLVNVWDLKKILTSGAQNPVTECINESLYSCNPEARQRSQLIHTDGKLVADDYQIAICTLHVLQENNMYQHINSIHVIDFLDNTQVVSEIDVAN